MLQLQLTLEEINTILTALGDRPYVQVYELIRKLQQQAQAQVGQGEEGQVAQVVEEEKK